MEAFFVMVLPFEVVTSGGSFLEDKPNINHDTAQLRSTTASYNRVTKCKVLECVAVRSIFVSRPCTTDSKVILHDVNFCFIFPRSFLFMLHCI